jgi:hypothetical protein
LWALFPLGMLILVLLSVLVWWIGCVVLNWLFGLGRLVVWLVRERLDWGNRGLISDRKRMVWAQGVMGNWLWGWGFGVFGLGVGGGGGGWWVCVGGPTWWFGW